MCLAVPAKLIEKNGLDGIVAFGDIKRNVRLDLLPDAQIGDYVLLHTGFAIEKVDEEQAKKMLATIQEVYGEVPV